jgi:hypothetical protein
VEGKVVLQGIENVLGKEKIELDLSNLPGGLYMVRIQSGNRNFFGRFIKY